MTSRKRPDLYAANAAAAYLSCDRSRVYLNLEPAATVHESSGRTHPLYDERDLIEYAAQIAADKAVAQQAVA